MILSSLIATMDTTPLEIRRSIALSLGMLCINRPWIDESEMELTKSFNLSRSDSLYSLTTTRLPSFRTTPELAITFRNYFAVI
jgi:hypothetical protein